ncbi:hypothetical protein ACHHYP_02641 [Achlya hypogyna]|uniref:Sodium/calcium exchanger membrane region domain-containing protein n=1 Tax=Achlya hypogyna TaxID=1202772 RepID=A0A1V9Z5Z1_ACHHY|nr:hypothetical protein ACHHYP_02641 [Achlya hypogyna]
MRAVTLALLATLAAGVFVFPDNCGRASFVDVPDDFRCACAHATRVSSWDYLSAHYCTFAATPILSSALLAALLCLLFYAVGNTTDQCMVPAVTYIAEATRMDPGVAGATLLAFANGAPDLFSCVASFSGVHTHSGFGIGGLLGSGLVVTVFTLGHLAYLAGGFDLRKAPFMRDVSFYLTTVLGLLAAYRVGFISVPMTVIAMLWYALYTSAVVRMRRAPVVVRLGTEKLDSAPRDYAVVAIDTPTSNSDGTASTTTDDDANEQACELSLASTDTATPWSIWCYVTDWDVAGTPERAVILAIWPFLVLRQLTVPRLDAPRVSTRELSLCAFVIPIFLLCVATRFLKVHALGWAVAGGAGILLAGGTYVFCVETSLAWRLLRAFLTLFLSSLWVFVIGHEIVSVMYVLGVSCGVSSGTLGILVLAWGNSIGDFVGNRALVKQGHVQMAAAACLAGPIFNTLMGGGLSIFLGCLQATDHTVAIWSADHNGTLAIGFCILATALLSLLLLGHKNEGSVAVTQGFGIFLVSLYAVFCGWTLFEEMHT